MLFNSLDFGIFLPLVAILYWTVFNRYGVRLRNERLVFNTIQIRLGIAFGKPGLVESEYFRLSNATRLEQWRYRPTRPEIVTFE